MLPNRGSKRIVDPKTGVTEHHLQKEGGIYRAATEERGHGNDLFRRQGSLRRGKTKITRFQEVAMPVRERPRPR